MKIKKINIKNWIIDMTILKKLMYFLLGILIISVICFIIIWGGRPYGEKLNEGDISMRNIYAPFNFTARDGIDEETTADLKRQASAKINDIYVLDDKVSENIYRKLDDFFNEIIVLQKQGVSEEENITKKLHNRFNLDISSDQINILLQMKDIEKTHQIIKSILQYVFNKGLMPEENLIKLDKNDVKTISLYKDGKLKNISFGNILSKSTMDRVIQDKLIEYFPDDKDIRDIMDSIILLLIEPNMKFDSDITEREKEKVRAKVSPVYNRIFVKQNEQIVERGQRVNKRQIKLLNTIDQIQRGENGLGYILGVGGIIVLFAVSLLLFLRVYQPSFLNLSSLLLLGLLVLFLVVIARVITFSPLSSYLIPVASISMLTAILLNFHLAILITIFLSFITGLMIGDGLTVAIVFFSGGIFSLFMLRNIRSRVKILKATLVVSSINFFMIVALGYFQNLDYETFFTQSLWGVGNGLLSGLLVMGLLPVFEYIFNITTDISLLEMSDLNHPLLKKMILKAPGTYHHSLIVGNLSEAACEDIGANSLLARVASYFHDIGKTDKAEYFAENQTQTQSKHDKLTPDMSKLIIIKHVKEGIALAKKFKLKQSIIDIIAQHHGTGLVFYFFKRALDEKMDEVEVDEEHYRYPGPKPQTREAAVVLLADSVEAASRALSGPTPARIKAVVRKVINNKFIDGQLDECDLTLKELDKIAEVFIRILTGVFHSRIEYPEKLLEEES